MPTFEECFSIIWALWEKLGVTQWVSIGVTITFVGAGIGILRGVLFGRNQ